MKNEEYPLLMSPLNDRQSPCPARNRAKSLFGKQTTLCEFISILVYAVMLSGCASTVRRPETTRSYIPESEVRSAVALNQIYSLSAKQRLMYEKRASRGDIEAAQALLKYHQMVTGNEKQYRRWSRVVARLQEAGRRQNRSGP